MLAAGTPTTAAHARHCPRAVPGTTLYYTVRLRNTSPRPFRFRRCPLYLESLGNANEVHVLNCHPAGTIASGGSAPFAMQLRVPRTLQRGSALAFELGLGTYRPPDWSAPATVKR